MCVVFLYIASQNCLSFPAILWCNDYDGWAKVDRYRATTLAHAKWHDAHFLEHTFIHIFVDGLCTHNAKRTALKWCCVDASPRLRAKMRWLNISGGSSYILWMCCCANSAAGCNIFYVGKVWNAPHIHLWNCHISIHTSVALQSYTHLFFNAHSTTFKSIAFMYRGWQSTCTYRQSTHAADGFDEHTRTGRQRLFLWSSDHFEHKEIHIQRAFKDFKIKKNLICFDHTKWAINFLIKKSISIQWPIEDFC